jgi:hypothetical protein
MRSALRALAALVLLLAGCEWNERSVFFNTYGEYAASDLARGGVLPGDLLPRSARGIKVVRNIDTTEVEATFTFDPADEEAVVSPFLNFEQRRLRLAVKEGLAPPAAAAAPGLLLRCGEGAMEFLQVTDHRSARYWTSWDKAQRAIACTTNATGVTSPGGSQ